MKLTEILNEKNIEIGLNASNKEQLLNSMLNLAERSGKIKDKNEVIKEIFKREKIMSTGVGKSIALPHAKTDSVDGPACSFAILEEPVDFDSLDGEPVSLVFLLLGRESDVTLHLKLLSKVSRILNNESYRVELSRSKSAKDIQEIFSQIDES
jgi:fructose-specific phosphotransferase system IIA component